MHALNQAARDEHLTIAQMHQQSTENMVSRTSFPQIKDFKADELHIRTSRSLRIHWTRFFLTALLALRILMAVDVALFEGSGPGSLSANADWPAGESSVSLTGMSDGIAMPDGLASVSILDDFEDPGWPDPNLWTLEKTNAPTWWPSECRPRTGQHSLWAFGGMIGDIEQPCGAGAPRGSVSRIYQHLDLRKAEDASQLELLFEAWLAVNQDPDQDTGLFIFLHVDRDGDEFRRVPIFGVTGVSGNWAFPSRRLDLANLTDIANPIDIYDLRGVSATLEWVAVAPQGSPSGAGVFIDDIRLLWEPHALHPAPTRRPTSMPRTPSPSATPTASPTRTRPSETPRPTKTPTPTATPLSFREIYLPWLSSAIVVHRPTNTPTSEVP